MSEVVAVNQEKIEIYVALESLIEEGNSILKTKFETMHFVKLVDFGKYKSWHTKVLSYLHIILPKDSPYITNISEHAKNYLTYAENCINSLKAIKEQIEKGYISLATRALDIDSLSVLNRIFSRFHQIAKQLRSRHDDRHTLDVEDEYDVQDLLHAVLRLYFDDIRPEEWTPSYGGGSSRMDFLLKNEKIVIEVKKIRKGLNDKALGEQLIVDIEKYRNHPDCNHLICFVYDPEGKLGNPTGIENDLNSEHNGFVEVIIKP